MLRRTLEGLTAMSYVQPIRLDGMHRQRCTDIKVKRAHAEHQHKQTSTLPPHSASCGKGWMRGTTWQYQVMGGGCKKT